MKKIRVINIFSLLFGGLLLLLTNYSEGAFTVSAKFNSADILAVRVSASDTDSAEPNITVSPNGSIYLVWVEHQENSKADVYLQKFGRDKMPIGEKVRINPNAGRATAWRGDPPSVKTGAENTVYVAWNERVEVEAGSANDLYLSVSHDGGKTFDSAVKVNDDKLPAVHGMHSMTIDKNNFVYFSWLDERYLHKAKSQSNIPKKEMSQSSQHHMEMNRDVYFTVSKDGGKSFATNKKVAADACPCCKTSIISDVNGSVYISWRQVLPEDFRHIAIAVSNNGGDSFMPPIIVSDDKWQIAGCPVSGATLLTEDNGKTIKVLWYSAGDAGKQGLYWAESKDNGSTFTPRTLVYQGLVTNTPLLMTDKNGKYKIVWQSSGRVMQTTTQLISGEDNSIEEIGIGTLPTAAVLGDQLFVSYVQNIGDKRSIWLY